MVQNDFARSHGALHGQVVAVTGAAQGMGRAHAVASARAGADVVLIDRVSAEDPELRIAAELVREAGARALVLQADVTDAGELQRAAASALEAFGKVDAVVINAGIFAVESILAPDEGLWNRMLDVNLTGALRTLRAFAPSMVERRSGSFVFIASVNGKEPNAGYAAYATSKAGVLGLMRNAALELAQFDIRCNAILPGVVDTPMAASLRGDRTDAEIRAARRRVSALESLLVLQPEDIAAAAVFLNSPAARGITGVELPVDAGHLALPGVNLTPID